MKPMRPFPAAALLLPALLALQAPALRGQEPPPAATAPAHEGPSHEGQAPEGQVQEGPSHEGQAHEGQAHEGQGEAHHGPVVKLFGRVLGPGLQSLVKLFNFVLFAGAIFLGLRGALASAFRARARELEDKLSQAEREKAEGEAQILALEDRMAGLQQELEGIMARAATDAEAERERILEAARQDAVQIMAQTREEIAYQQRLAERELRSLVAGLAVEGAARRLGALVQGDVARGAMDEAIQQVGGAQ